MPGDCPATGPTGGRGGIVGRVRMGGDQRRAGGAGCPERALEPAVEGDQAAQADRNRMGRECRIVVVVGELEPGTMSRPNSTSARQVSCSISPR